VGGEIDAIAKALPGVIRSFLQGPQLRCRERLLFELLKKTYDNLLGFRRRYLFEIMFGFFTALVDSAGVVYFGSLVAATFGQDNYLARLQMIAGEFGVELSNFALVAILLVLYGAKSGLTVVAGRRLTRLSYETRMHLQTRLLRGFLIDTPYKHLASRSTGDFVHRNFSVINGFVSELLQPTIAAVIHLATGILIFLYLLWLNPVPALIIAGVSVAVGLLYTKAVLKPLKNASKDLHRVSKKLTQIFFDCVYSAKEARVQGLEEHYISLARSNLSGNMQRIIMFNTVQAVPRITYELLLCVAFLVFVAAGGGFGVQQTHLTSQFSIFLIAALKLLPASSQILLAITLLNYRRHAIDDLHREFARLTIWQNRRQERNLPSRDVLADWSELNLAQVDFSYTEDVPVLQGIDARIPRGLVTGITGPSGDGKTTLLDLVLGLLEPSSGSVRLGPYDLRECLASWRRQIGYMSQTLFLLDDTIEANLRLGSSGPFDQEFAMQCLREAGLPSFADTEHLAFVVGERGARLSGGQRQRLVIARLLYGRKSVLVMDEPTASLDAEAEETIVQTIEKLRGTRTFIIVSHSERVMNCCDQVLEIRGGKAVSSTRIARSA
jgi:ABC-type bacteriocin/lantibiotic exporter with double-glycine peptidase domain